MKCLGCKIETHEDDMSGPLCDGCAENEDMFKNSDDPHGKDWQFGKWRPFHPAHAQLFWRSRNQLRRLRGMKGTN